MSEEVKTEEVPPAQILPAKSEDKLEIEKEEQEAKEKTEEEKGEGEEKKEEKEGETEVKDEDKKEEETKKETEETGEDGGGGGKEKKRFKMPNVHLKTPKVPDFLRSKSKERKKVRAPSNFYICLPMLCLTYYGFLRPFPQPLSQQLDSLMQNNISIHYITMYTYCCYRK